MWLLAHDACLTRGTYRKQGLIYDAGASCVIATWSAAVMFFCNVQWLVRCGFSVFNIFKTTIVMPPTIRELLTSSNSRGISKTLEKNWYTIPAFLWWACGRKEMPDVLKESQLVESNKVTYLFFGVSSSWSLNLMILPSKVIYLFFVPIKLLKFIHMTYKVTMARKLLRSELKWFWI